MAAQKDESDCCGHSVREEIIHRMRILRDHRPIGFILVMNFVEFVKECYLMEESMSSILEDILNVVNERNLPKDLPNSGEIVESKLDRAELQSRQKKHYVKEH